MTPNRSHRRYVTGCPTGKRGFPERRAAKAAARHLACETGTSKPRPYRCPQCGLWHVGHLAPPIMRGWVAAADFYGDRP